MSGLELMLPEPYVASVALNAVMPKNGEPGNGDIYLASITHQQLSRVSTREYQAEKGIRNLPRLQQSTRRVEAALHTQHGAAERVAYLALGATYIFFGKVAAHREDHRS